MKVNLTFSKVYRSRLVWSDTFYWQKQIKGHVSGIRQDEAYLFICNGVIINYIQLEMKRWSIFLWSGCWGQELFAVYRFQIIWEFMVSCLLKNHFKEISWDPDHSFLLWSNADNKPIVITVCSNKMNKNRQYTMRSMLPVFNLMPFSLYKIFQTVVELIHLVSCF